MVNEVQKRWRKFWDDALCRISLDSKSDGYSVENAIIYSNGYKGFVPKSTNPVPPPPEVKPDSPTSHSHYKAYDIEAIEMMIRIWGKQRVAEWCEITAFKYRLRMGMKDDVQQDLEKEAYYLAKWKELRDDVAG